MDVKAIQQSLTAPSPAAGRLSPAAVEAPDSAPPVATPSRGGVESVIVQQEFPPNTRLRLDEESNRIVAQVLDENNEVVRQVPPQELLEISARFNRLEGVLFDEQL